MAVRNTLQSYGTIAVARAVRLSLRQLYYWVNVVRVVRPRLRRHGARRFRSFSADEVATLRAVKRLMDRGYTLRAAVRASKRS